jgi:hypothetical protein
VRNDKALDEDFLRGEVPGPAAASEGSSSTSCSNFYRRLLTQYLQNAEEYLELGKQVNVLTEVAMLRRGGFAMEQDLSGGSGNRKAMATPKDPFFLWETSVRTCCHARMHPRPRLLASKPRNDFQLSLDTSLRKTKMQCGIRGQQRSNEAAQPRKVSIPASR